MTFRTTASKIAATGLAASIAALAAGAGNASAAPNGIGSASVATTMLDAKVGSLLNLTLLKDSSFANTDTAAGPLGAVAKLTSLQLSSTVTALNQTLGDYRVSSPGSPSTLTSSVLDLGSTGIPTSVLSGQIEPVTLTALHSPTSATSTTARITHLDALGGILDVGAVTSTDKTGSGTLAAQATRNVAIDSINGLKLGELLKMLGFDLLKLPLATVNGLLQTLGLTVGLPTDTNLATYVGSLGTAISDLVNSTNTTVDSTLAGTLAGLPGIGAVVPTVGAAKDTAIAALNSVLQTLIQKVVDALDNAVLLQVTALNLAANTKATDAVATSVATASGTLGGIKVGKLEIPGVDLAATADTINNTLANVEGALNTVLAPLGIADIIKVRLFERNTLTSAADGYVKAVASITALSVKVTPPANLSGIVAGLGAGLPLLGDGAGLTSTLPELGQALGGVQSVLKDGVSLEVGKVAAQSLHAVPATATPAATGVSAPGTLPHTGGNAAPLAFGALTLGALALGARRLGRRSQSAE
jgi:hypothetical protein